MGKSDVEVYDKPLSCQEVPRGIEATSVREHNEVRRKLMILNGLYVDKDDLDNIQPPEKECEFNLQMALTCTIP